MKINVLLCVKGTGACMYGDQDVTDGTNEGT